MTAGIIAAETQEVRDKVDVDVDVDVAAYSMAYKERLNMPVNAEVVMREQSEHLRDYFIDRLRLYRERSLKLPRSSNSQYTEMTN